MLSIISLLYIADSLKHQQQGGCGMKCHIELSVGQNGRWWIYFIVFKRLLLSPINCHSGRDFDWKSLSALFE
jgi:hypothetical protein